LTISGSSFANRRMLDISRRGENTNALREHRPTLAAVNTGCVALHQALDATRTTTGRCAGHMLDAR